MDKHLPKSSKLLRFSILVVCMVILGGGWEAFGQRNPRITVSIQDQTLQKAFEVIGRQSGFNFVYGDDYLDNTGLVTLEFRNASIDEVMQKALSGTGLWYRIEGRDIIIVSPKFQQPSEQGRITRNVNGVVFDSKGAPLSGVSVTIKGTDRGALTDVNGYFSLLIPTDGSVLKFSHLSMETQEMSVIDQTNLRINMKEGAAKIDEVVVTAYGLLQKREDLVGSATQVNAEQIKTLPVTRVDRMLEGLVPGFSINAQSNVAEGRNRYSTRIRGESSLNASGEPLWIIDGVRMYTGNNANAISGSAYSVSPLSLIDPNDIESLTVLKDATQTAIYGADGGNGIVLITTKRGTKGKPKITASLKYGMGFVDNSTKFKLLNGSQYLTLAKEAWRNAGHDMAAFPWQDNELNAYSQTDTDWYDLYLGASKRLNANISIFGGSEYMSNYMSIGYYDEQPMALGNRTQRINTRFNSETELTRKLRFSLKLGMTYGQNDIFNVGRDFYETLPIYSPYYDGTGEYRLMNAKTTILKKGEYNPYTGELIRDDSEIYYPYQYRFANSLAGRDENEVRNRVFTGRGNAMLSYEIIRGLELSGEFGMEYRGSYDNSYFARTNLSGGEWARVSGASDPTRPLEYVPTGNSQRYQANNMVWNNLERLMFSRKFGRHAVNAFAALELYQTGNQIIQTSGRGFPNDKMKEVGFSVDNTRNAYSSSNIERKLSYFGQFNYAFDSRYYISGSFRKDGSSTFGEYHQWATFYSVGASWNVHNEPFFNVSAINMLKLKGSYGTVGNSRMESFYSEGTVLIGGSNGYRNNIGGIMGDAPNPGLSWETVYKTNIGLDIGLLNNAIEVGLEWYNHLTDDLISELPVSNLTGTNKIARNAGIMQNRGIELLLTTRNIRTPDFMWKTTFTLAHNKNKVVKLYEEASKSFFDHGWYEGYEKNVWTLVRWAGVDPRDGSPLFYDDRGNVTRTYDYSYRVPMFNLSRYPTVEGALTNTLVWKDFEFYMQINYSIGGWAESAAIASTMDDGKDLNSLTMAANGAIEMLGRWQEPGQLATVPVLIDGATRYSMSYNTRDLYNRTNVRLTNVALTYNLPAEFCEKIRLSRASVSLIADNLYFFSPYQSATKNSYKTTYAAYPLERVFTLGIDVNF